MSRLPRPSGEALKESGPRGRSTTAQAEAQREQPPSKQMATVERQEEAGAAPAQDKEKKVVNNRKGERQPSEEAGENLGGQAAVTALAKLSLTSCQGVGALQGTVHTTHLLGSSLACIVAAEQEGKADDHAVKAAGRGHTHGAPHPACAWPTWRRWWGTRRSSRPSRYSRRLART